ncbi:hypothetical protein BDR26DRAFT_712918 [Obelidium mucronatum]|nr:hypothetical protein BDR26DRAFT_712918 [Obelidium mucronatum]
MRHHHQLAIFSFIVACYFLVRFLALQLSSNDGPTTPSSDATATAPSHSLVSHHGIGYLHLDVKDYSSGCPKPKQALIAVFTTASAQDAEKRQLLRQIYQDWNKELEGHDQIDVRFYFGNGVDYNSDMALAAEQALFDDVVVMEEAVEHRDNGKILEWFKYARSVLYSRHPSKDSNYCLRYRFIGKGDVDAVIHIKRLSRILSGLSDDSRYIGRSFVVPHYHMTGMLYLVTSDIVEWINFSPIPKQHLNGVEDVQVGKWLLESKIHFKKAEQYNRFHDLEESPNVCYHFFIMD